MEERLELAPLADVECADSFGSIDFMAGDIEKIGSKSPSLDRNLAQTLGGVDVKENVFRLAEGSDLFQRLDCPDFVLTVNEGYQGGVRAQSLLEFFGTDLPLFVDAEEGDLMAEVLKKIEGLDGGGMVHARADEVKSFASALRGESDPLDDMIARLGRARAEDDLLGGAPKGLSHLVSGRVDGSGGGLAMGVRGAWMSLAVQASFHDLYDFGVHRGRGVVV